MPVRFSVSGRDLEGAVAEVKDRVARKVQLPEGIHLEWVGEYSELQAANRRLAIVIPVALLLIMGVLFAATLSMVNFSLRPLYRWLIRSFSWRRFHSPVSEV